MGERQRGRCLTAADHLHKVWRQKTKKAAWQEAMRSQDVMELFDKR